MPRRTEEQRGLTHAKMEANAPPQSLPALCGHGVAEDYGDCRGSRPDRVQRRAGLPLRPHTAGSLLAGPGAALCRMGHSVNWKSC